MSDASAPFTNQVPPHHLEAERAVLGSALVSAEALALLIARVPVEAFFLDTHRLLRACLERLHAHAMPVDLLTVRAALADAGDLDAIGGPAALALLVEEAALAIHVEAYATLILEAAAKRELVALAGELLYAAQNGTAPAAIVTGLTERLHRAQTLAAGPAPTAGGPEIIDLPELLTRAFPPRQNLVGPALLPHQGLAVLGGSPRVGKSLLCTNLALCRALGRPWCGFALAPGATVYVQAEIPEARLQARVRLMLDGLPPPPAGRLYTITKRNLFIDTPSGRDTLIRALETLATTAPTAPDLLIIDPLARFYSGDENNQREVGRLVATLDALIERFAVAILIPHHPAKPIKGDVKEGGAKLRGVSGLWAAADGTWWLARSGQGLSLTFEDLRHGEPPAPLYLERSPELWLLPAEAPTDERLAAVARCVLGIGLSWTKLRAAVVADLDVPERTAERLINHASKAGLIAKEDDGIYRQPSRNRQTDAGGSENP